MANFLSATANFEDFINLSSVEINSHVQKNNEAILKKSFTFFQNESKILIIGGFAGVGKKQIAEHTLSYLDKKVITLKFYCTESSKLDDIHLEFLKILKQKVSSKDTSELDAINSVADKIEFFLSKAELKFVPIFYNFDSITDNSKPEIINYILSISSKENIKTVICSKTFDTDLIPENLMYQKIMAKPLSKDNFENYIRGMGIKITPAMLDQLYRLTRGYFFSLCLCCKIMINQEYSANDFIVQYTNSGEKFDVFLAKTYYRLIVGTTKSAFNLFVKLHHGLNIKVLQSIGSYPENILKMLAENFYIYRKGDLFYPSEFLKQQLEDFIPDEISKKRLTSYYEKQIELSPENRDFLISRQSLLEEIAFYKGIDVEPSESSNTVEQEPQHVTEQKAEIKDSTPDYENFSIEELVKKTEDYFAQYDYLKALDVLTFILGKKSTIQGTQILYKVYKLIAETYTKLSKWNYALYYYDLLESHYSNLSELENMYLIQYEKASIFYQIYKIVDSIKLLKSLVTLSKSNYILAGSNIMLGNISLSASNKQLAVEYYKHGIARVDDTVPNSMKMELYFKYAVLSDEFGDIGTAVEYYNKCIHIDEKESKYIALAYSNMGDLFYDNDLKADAKACFQKAYEADKLNKNEYGMYYSLSKVLELTDNTDKDLLVKLAKEVKEHALKTDDYNALLLSIIKLGDVYYDYPEPEKALAEYLSLYREGVEVIEELNFSMIKARIEDIRARLGKERFEELVPDYA